MIMRGPVDYVFDGILSPNLIGLFRACVTRRNTPQVNIWMSAECLGIEFYEQGGCRAVELLFLIHVR